MLEVNPSRLAAFESELHAQGKRLIAGCEELSQIRSALAQMTQMDQAIAAIRSCTSQMEEEYGKLMLLERAAEQIGRMYSDCENRVTVGKLQPETFVRDWWGDKAAESRRTGSRCFEGEGHRACGDERILTTCREWGGIQKGSKR